MKTEYIINRLIQVIPVMLGIITLTFLMLRLAPGDPITIYMGVRASEEELQILKHVYGFDKPIYMQYFDYLRRIAVGDFGTSMTYQKPVFEIILKRLPVTLSLVLYSLAFSVIIAIPSGIYSALHKNKISDHIVRFISLIGVSIPRFFTAILLIYLLGYYLELLPISGYIPLKQDFIEGSRHLILPAVSLGGALMGYTMRVMRSSMLEVLGENYIKAARAFGLHEKLIVWRYALRNALLPVITIIGLQFSTLLGGSIIIEEIFGIEGIGRLTYRALLARDYPLIQGVVIYYSFLFLLSVIIVDILYAVIDPRIKYE